MRYKLTALLTVLLSLWLSGCTAYPGVSTPNGNAVQAPAVSDNEAVEAGIRDGEYDVPMEFEGGTGKLKIVSPVRVTVRDGNMTARLILQSSHYDYMKVDGEKYLPLQGEDAVEDCSVFDIPIKSPDESIDVIGDTTAMSTPHEIEYKLKFDWSVIDGLAGGSENVSDISDISDTQDGSAAMDMSGRADASNGDPAIVSLDNIETVRADDGTVIPKNITGPDGKVIEFTDTVERKYAQMFSIALSDDGYAFIHIEGSGDHLVNLCKPIENIYLVSSSAMDIFAALDEDLSDLAFTGLDKKDWKVEAAVNAMDKGTLKYAGKYSAPDYELLLSGGCGLAIENTMVYHKPEVVEKLGTLGIPVIVEVSSYEPHPMGRMEWIKLYGVLTGRKDEAERIFEEKIREVAPILEGSNGEDIKESGDGQTVAFFYVASNGAVNVRKSSDYISRMISMAGGRYIPGTGEDEDGNALSTVNMQMEAFYAGAVDADILIYNGTVSGEIGSIDDLLKKDKLFADFKAVKNGRVYTTDDNLYQKTMSIPQLILDLDKILNDGAADGDELVFLRKVD